MLNKKNEQSIWNKKKQLVCFFLLFSCCLFSQNTIKGIVVNALGKPINQVNVFIKDKNDTTIDYAITNSLGAFTILIKNNGEYTLKITCLGFKTINQKIVLSKMLDLGTIILEESNIELKEVIVKNDKSGMTEIGDTLKYRIEKFLNGTEETLGDVIKKMPGLDVDKNGKIKANGKQVDKLLIDGQEFFTDQEKVATDNITANMIKNLELIKNYKEFKNIDKNKETGLTALNVTIKEQFKNKFTGNIESAFGNKYKMHATLFNFRKKMLLSFISDSNNTGELSITLQDYTNFIGKKEDETIGEVQYSNFDNLPKFLTLGNNVKERYSSFNGLNLKYMPANNFQINSYFIYNKVNQFESEFNKQTYYTSTSPFVNNEKKENEENTNFFTGFINSTFKPKDNRVFDYSLNFNSLIRKLDSSLDNISNEYDEKTRDNDYEINHRFSFANNLKDNNKLLFVLYQNLSQKTKDLSIASNNPFLDLLFSNSDYQINQSTKTRKNEIGFNSSYGFQFKKINFSIYSELVFSDHKIENFENQFSQFNNSIGFKINSQTVGLESRFKIIGKTFLTTKVNFTTAVMNYNLSSDNKNLLSPSIGLKTIFNPNHTMKMTFSKNNNFMAIENLLVNQQIKDYLTIYQNENVNFNTVSPNYKVSFDYFNANIKSNFTIISSISFCEAKNVVSYNAITSSTVSQLNYRLSPFEKSINSFVFTEKTFKKIPFSLKSSISYYENKDVSYVSNEETKFKTETFDYFLSMLSRLKKTSFQFEIGGQYVTSFFFNPTSNSSSKFSSVFFETSFKLSKDLSFINKLSFNKNESSDFKNNLFILSPRIRYAIPKTKFEISLIGNNVLNLQNTEQVTVNQNNNYIQERISKIISGYFLFNLKVKL